MTIASLPPRTRHKALLVARLASANCRLPDLKENARIIRCELARPSAPVRVDLNGLFAPRGALRTLLPDHVDMNLYFARDAL